MNGPEGLLILWTKCDVIILYGEILISNRYKRCGIRYVGWRWMIDDVRTNVHFSPYITYSFIHRVIYNRFVTLSNSFYLWKLHSVQERCILFLHTCKRVYLWNCIPVPVHFSLIFSRTTSCILTPWLWHISIHVEVHSSKRTHEH